jgi:hypothetical protein
MTAINNVYITTLIACCFNEILHKNKILPGKDQCAQSSSTPSVDLDIF